MDKRNLTIVGSYDTRAEALTAIDQLRGETKVQQRRHCFVCECNDHRAVWLRYVK